MLIESNGLFGACSKPGEPVGKVKPLSLQGVVERGREAINQINATPELPDMNRGRRRLPSSKIVVGWRI